MANENKNAWIFKHIKEDWKGKRAAVTNQVGVIAQNFFMRGFPRGGQMLNGVFVPWKLRKFTLDRSGGDRKVLTKSGALGSSIRQTNNSNGRIEIFTNKKQAQLLSDGGKLPITAKMRRFFWAMYFKEIGKIKPGKNGTIGIKRGQEQFNKYAKVWKNLAMTKKSYLQFDARPIFYDSSDLADEGEKYLIKQIDNSTNQ